MNYQRGMITAYNSSSSPNFVQYGGSMVRRRRPVRRYQTGTGFMDFIKKGINTGKRAIDWAKRNQIASKIGNVANAVGATNYLNQKTGGKFGQAVDLAVQKGFGRRRKRQTGGRRRTRRY